MNMKTTKQFMMLCCLMVMVAMGYAQQWEIDYSNGESYIAYVNGILDAEGNGIMVGGCGPVYPNCHPIVMHIESDGTHFLTLTPTKS